jgi:hypothetical protein
MKDLLLGICLLLGFVYMVMTFIAYNLVKPEHKASVLSGWWCLDKSHFQPKHHSFVMVGKALMLVILITGFSSFIGQ